VQNFHAEISCYDIFVPSEELATWEFQALGEFRYLIRRFLRVSEEFARTAGLAPQQHQALLAIKALNDPAGPTVAALAECLLIRHQSAVGLVDRLQHRGLVNRVPGTEDRREMRLFLTAAGDEVLRRLSLQHREELRVSGPALTNALASLIEVEDESRVGRQ
jgi:DNA-binding MarR family transcriptional regulator